MKHWRVVCWIALAAPLPGGAGLAQEPPDSLSVLADTIALPDTVVVADTIPPVDLPRIRVGPQPGWARGVWEWDRETLMSVRDLTLLEILETVPGVVPLRGGDYGAPESASALAAGGGRIRVFWDGFELPPLDGGAPDLALLGLGGIERVKVERGPGELRIHIESRRADDPRPFSMVEAGTGDLDSNFFRGTFMHPRVLGGILGFALERVDTRGPFRREPGSRTGGWISWGRPLGEALAVRVEGRQVERDVALARFPLGLGRTDWVIRGRGRFLDDALTGELFTGSSSLSSKEHQDFLPLERTARQHGLRLAWEPGPLWASGSFRLSGGVWGPSHVLEIEGGSALSGLGGVHGRFERSGWEGRGTAHLTLNAHTEAFHGLSVYGSFARGQMGAPVPPDYQRRPTEDPGEGEGEEGEEEVAPPGPRFSDQTALRLGAAYALGPARVQAALLSLEVDSLPPLGLALDRGGPVAAGGTFRGWEAELHLDLPIRGFTLQSTVQWWDSETRYLPARVYQGAVQFHELFMESGNLEVWGALGMRGRDPMLVPRAAASDDTLPTLERVPFYQSWYADVQIRVVSVNIFIRWENFTLRQNLSDFPGRTLPYTRALYGVRWTLWN